MRFVAFLLTLAAPLSAASAQTETVIAARAGQVVRTQSGIKVGLVDRANNDGSIRIIYGERFVTLPADTIKNEDGKITTSLGRGDIAKLRN